MRTRLPLRPFALAACLGLVGMVSAACELAVASFKAEARDEWVRSYPLAGGGTFEVGNTNGAVEVSQTTGSTVEVRAERVAKAASEEAARDLLKQLEIREDVSGAHVRLETKAPSGIRWGGLEVRYTVRRTQEQRRMVPTRDGHRCRCRCTPCHAGGDDLREARGVTTAVLALPVRLPQRSTG